MYSLNFIKGPEKKLLYIKTDDAEKGHRLLITKAKQSGYTRKNSIFEFNESYGELIYIELIIIPKDYLIDNLGHKYYITHKTELEELTNTVYNNLKEFNVNYAIVKTIVERCYKEYKEE